MGSSSLVNDEEPLSMWIVVNALFDSYSLISYVMEPYWSPIDPNCFNRKGLSIGFGTCFSLNRNFHGSWSESQKVCKKQDADLLSAYHLYDWTEIMRSHIIDWYVDKTKIEEVEFDGRVDAIALLRSSSVMYLGMISYQNEVGVIFIC